MMKHFDRLLDALVLFFLFSAFATAVAYAVSFGFAHLVNAAGWWSLGVSPHTAAARVALVIGALMGAWAAFEEAKSLRG